MSLPIRRKLEKALVSYVRARAVAGTRLFNLMPNGIVPGHSNEEPTLPYLVVFVDSAPPHPDMPAESGIKLCKPIFHLKTDSSADAREVTDNILAELEAVLMQPLDDNAPYSDENKAGAQVLFALNKPAVEEDRRADDLKKFHAYDFSPSEDTVSLKGQAWHDQLVFECPCQPFDSH